MTNKTLYQILGIEIRKNATKESIKKAFYDKSRIHHPDKGGNAKSFAEIGKAYRVLQDPEKRARYDKGDDVDSILSTKNNRTTTIIVEIFYQVLNNVDLQNNDIVDLIETNIKENKTRLNDNIIKLEKEIDKLNLCLPNIKHKSEDNILVNVIKAGIERAVNGIDNYKKETGEWDKALKLMEEYSYDFTPKETYHIDLGFNSSGFGSTAT